MKTLKYNIPGTGVLTVNLYDYTSQLYDYYEELGTIRTIKSIPQLGHLSNIVIGAHHTRYEYMFIQWALISKFRDYAKGSTAVSRTFPKYFRIINEIDPTLRGPSGTDVMQSITLLTNIGHHKLTYSFSRALTHILKNNKNSKDSFIGLMPDCLKRSATNIIELCQWELLHIIMPFALTKQRNSNTRTKTLREYSANVVSTILSAEESPHSIRKLINAHSNMKALAAVSLDLHFAPISLELPLAPLLLNFEDYVDDFTSGDRGYTSITNMMARLLRKAVYGTDESIIYTSEISQYLKDQMTSLTIEDLTQWQVQDELRKLYERDFDEITRRAGEIVLPRSSILRLNQDNGNRPSLQVKSVDDLADELGIASSIPDRGITICHQWEVGRRHLVSLIVCNYSRSLNVRMSRAAHAIKQIYRQWDMKSNKYKEYHPRLRSKMELNIFEFLISSSMGSKYMVKFEFDDNGATSQILFDNFVKINGKVAQHLASSERLKAMSPDRLCELRSLLESLTKYSSTGNTSCAIAQVQILLHGNVVAEFDGVFFSFSRKFKIKRMCIVESKNQNCPFTKARRDLIQKLELLFDSEEVLSWQILQIEGGAVAVRAFN